MSQVDRLRRADAARPEREAVQAQAARPVLGRPRARDLTAERGMVQGWPIVGWAALGVAAVTWAMLANGVTEEALHRLLRVTAETSLVFFLLAFVASAL